MSPKDGTYEIVADPKQLQPLKELLTSRNIPLMMATVTYIPKQVVHLEGDKARKLLRLLQELEDHDDVQSVSANFDVPDAIMDEMSEAA